MTIITPSPFVLSIYKNNALPGRNAIMAGGKQVYNKLQSLAYLAVC